MTDVKPTPAVLRFLKQVMESAKDDSLERAQLAFKHCTVEEMGQLYGQSGRTRQQILNGYRAGRAAWADAADWVNSL